ncbi:MAG: DUF6499 domain-containing protein [Kiloniellales bacterium]|nr:DUF6499 domain-containing protein [Kiloniellales bacterium]
MAEYDYLDELDDAGWAWELLRRSDEYRSDYERLQVDTTDSAHDALAQKWHVVRMVNPDLREGPQFYCEQYESNYLYNLMWKAQWDHFMSKNKTPRFNLDTWKCSIICKDLQAEGCSLNQIAQRLYTGYKSPSHETQHHPARDRVRDDLTRFKKLQAAYLKIAYSQNLRA